MAESTRRRNRQAIHRRAHGPTRAIRRHPGRRRFVPPGFASLTQLALSGVQITACVIDVKSGRLLFSVDDHLSVPTASIGKVLLLIEVAARLSAGDKIGPRHPESHGQ